MSWMTGAEGWIALLTLTVLEIVLGIDNNRLHLHSRRPIAP